MRAVVVADPDELTAHVAAWDALAVRAGLPYCAPAWMLAWWRALAPTGSALRVVLVLDGEELAGVLPFHRAGPAGRVEVWRHLCAGFCARIGPLALPGREAEVAAAAARAMGGGPDVLALEGLPGGGPWPAELCAAWPGRLPPWRHHDLAMPAPAAVLDGDFPAWLARRGAGTRREAARRRRRLEEQGAVVRRAGAGELAAGVRELGRLYRARWAGRGGSERLAPGLEAMLADAAGGLGERFALWLVEREGRPVAAHLYVRAGAEVASFGGGFEAEWSRFAPTSVMRVAALEQAAADGVRRVEFGEGAQPDKQRFADEELPVEWVTLLPRGRRYPLARLSLAPKHARWAARGAARRLPPGVRERLRR